MALLGFLGGLLGRAGVAVAIVAAAVAAIAAATAQQLGVSATGVYVVEVTAGSGAEAAGVQAGDRIIAVDDTAVSSSNSVKSYLADKNVGDTVNLQVEREGKILTLAVTLGSSTQ